MKAILYSPDLGITSYEKFEINGVGTCYIFPENEDDSLEERLSFYYERNDTVFLIPMSLTEKFLKWLKDLTGNSYSWKEPDDSYLGDNEVAVKEKIANINDTNKVNFEGVLMSVIPIKDDALQVKMDEVANTANEIDCVFVASVKGGRVLRGTDENKVMETDRRFNAQMLESCLETFQGVLNVKNLQKGDLDYALFQVGKPAPAIGGILCLSIVPNTNSKLWIGFVSSTYAGAGMLTFYREENLDNFQQLINQYVPVK